MRINCHRAGHNRCSRLCVHVTDNQTRSRAPPLRGQNSLRPLTDYDAMSGVLVVGMSSFTPGASTQPLNVRQLRQGNDVGTQYRSAIFFHSLEQKAQARAKIDQLTAEGRFKPKRIVTKVEHAQTFWRAEEHHQRYLEKRGQTSCHI